MPPTPGDSPNRFDIPRYKEENLLVDKRSCHRSFTLSPLLFFRQRGSQSPYRPRQREQTNFQLWDQEKIHVCQKLVEIVCDYKLVLVDWCSIVRIICCHCRSFQNYSLKRRLRSIPIIHASILWAVSKWPCKHLAINCNIKHSRNCFK